MEKKRRMSKDPARLPDPAEAAALGKEVRSPAAASEPEPAPRRSGVSTGDGLRDLLGDYSEQTGSYFG